MDAKLRARIASRDWSVAPPRWWASAAVAVVLRGDPAELLLIERAQRDGDPWSGDIALPGGKRDPRDRDAWDTAAREAREEVGLDLTAAAARIGPLRPIWAVTHARRAPMRIQPVVFELLEPSELSLSSEVREVFWMPLAELSAPAARASVTRRLLGLEIRFPARRYHHRVIWGLTLKMLADLIS